MRVTEATTGRLTLEAESEGEREFLEALAWVALAGDWEDLQGELEQAGLVCPWTN